MFRGQGGRRELRGCCSSGDSSRWFGPEQWLYWGSVRERTPTGLPDGLDPEKEDSDDSNS